MRGAEAAAKEISRWESLARTAAEPNLFAEPWFVLAAVPLGEAPAAFEVLFVERGTELVGVFPMQRLPLQRGVPFHRLELYANEFLPLTLPLVRRGSEAEVMRTFLQWVRSDKKTIALDLPRAPASGVVHAALVDAARDEGLVLEQKKLYSRAFLDPLEPYDTFIKNQLSKGKRDQIQRTGRRLAEQGALTYEVLDRAEDLPRWIDEFLALEASGWKGREGTAMQMHPQTEAFFRAVMSRAFERKRLHFLAVRHDGRAIAMKTNLLDAPTSYTYKVAYDESYAKFSPGVLLEAESMRRISAMPEIHTMDSAGRAENPPFDSMWNERRSMGSFEISTGSVTSDLWVMAQPAARWLRHRGVVALGAAKAVIAGFLETGGF